MARVSIGRSRLPPDEIRWLATSGIIVTSEPVRDRIVLLTRAMSEATRPTSSSIDAVEGDSKGTITATQDLQKSCFKCQTGTCRIAARASNRKALQCHIGA